MGVMVALLRGVNVGGASTLPMGKLREVASACGYEDVRTYIQSGNLVFSAPDSATAAGVADELRTAIAERTTVRPAVVVRTGDELAAVVDANPFADRELAAVHVVFGPSADDASIAGIDLGGFAPEEAVTRRRETYLFLPAGVGRSRLAAAISRGKGGDGTMRSWRTVMKLLAMAGEPA